jgi:hypothetical protein
MSVDPRPLADLTAFLMLEANRVQASAEEVAQHVAAGNLDAAKRVLSLSRGHLADAEEAWQIVGGKLDAETAG